MCVCIHILVYLSIYVNNIYIYVYILYVIIKLSLLPGKILVNVLVIVDAEHLLLTWPPINHGTSGILRNNPFISIMSKLVAGHPKLCLTNLTNSSFFSGFLVNSPFLVASKVGEIFPSPPHPNPKTISPLPAKIPSGNLT